MTVSPTYPAVTQTHPANLAGRDFVVADLHGCYDQLMESLRRVGFDTTKDRLFSTGDLIDRGPKSLACLALLDCPWFYAVLGNHETLLMQAAGVNRNYVSSPSDFYKNGTAWVGQLSAQERSTLTRLIHERLVHLPLRREIMDPTSPFAVVHSQALYEGRIKRDREPTTWDMEYWMTWDRTMIDSVRENPWQLRSTQVQLNAREAAMSIKVAHQMAWHGGTQLTYVGHSIVKEPVFYGSHFFMDGGAYFNANRGLFERIWLVEHQVLSPQLKLFV